MQKNQLQMRGINYYLIIMFRSVGSLEKIEFLRQLIYFVLF